MFAWVVLMVVANGMLVTGPRIYNHKSDCEYKAAAMAQQYRGSHFECFRIRYSR